MTKKEYLNAAISLVVSMIVASPIEINNIDINSFSGIVISWCSIIAFFAVYKILDKMTSGENDER
ncbi:MAG: hypothetical protein PF450_02375 [Bacteroidales bacterium]|nr:hypothetical protein [Bacteroidales bacterium]